MRGPTLPRPVCEAVDVYRCERIDAMRELLARLGSLALPGADGLDGVELKQRHARYDHVVELAKAAAQGRVNPARLEASLKALELPAARLQGMCDTACGPLLAVDHRYALRSSIASETPTWIVPGDRQLRLSPAQRKLLVAAARQVHACGSEDLVLHGLSVIVLMSERSLSEATNSWTCTGFAGTICLDYQESPALLAKDLAHEAGHCWLNDALAALGENLHGAPEFSSPWKRELRPAFGMVHAGFAFSTAVLQLSEMLSANAVAQGPQTDLCKRHLTQERDRLAESAGAIRACHERLRTPALRDHLGATLDAALKASV